MDGGVKGNKKRIEIFVKYWSSSLQRVVESFLHAEMLNFENANNVTKMFLEIMRDKNLDLSKLVNIHTDSCSILRGRKHGAIKQISEVAPNVSKSDLGGDILHHIHNAEKRAFKESFPELDDLLKNIKYDIRTSPGKIERYLEVCEKIGEPIKMPVSYCTSRFLDKFQAVQDVLDHIETLKEFYATDSTKSKHPNSVALSDESDDESADENSSNLNFEDPRKTADEENNDCDNGSELGLQLPQVKNKAHKETHSRSDQLKACFLNPKKLFHIEANLYIARHCLKLGYDFLGIFQTSSIIKIHQLHDGMGSLLRETLLEILEAAALKNSKGGMLNGKNCQTSG